MDPESVIGCESVSAIGELPAFHNVEVFGVRRGVIIDEAERMLDKAGQRMPVEDSYIAATARRHGLTIATGNDRDFRRPGLRVFNPFKELT